MSCFSFHELVTYIDSQLAGARQPVILKKRMLIVSCSKTTAGSIIQLGLISAAALVYVKPPSSQNACKEFNCLTHAIVYTYNNM